MGRLASAAFTDPALRRAWAEVLASDADDGQLSAGVRRFEDDLDGQICRLVADLARDAYKPADLTQVTLDGADRRDIQIPTVRDRVVARAILEVVTPIVDPVLGSASYAYRPGLGVVDAVQGLARLRDEGFGWVLRTDVDSCFPTIPVDLARRRFGALVDDAELCAVVDRLLARAVLRPLKGRAAMKGLPQGCPLSPLLANLVLVLVDETVMGAGFPIIRYADDMAIAVASPEEGWEALRCVSEAVRRVSMSLGAEDTEIMSFDEGFTFLGEDFGPRYPITLAEARVDEPDRKVVYVATQGGRVRTGGGRLIVERADDVEVLDVPTSQVGRVVCFGAVGLSAGARSWAMSSDVPVVFASRRGSYLGSFVGGPGSSRPERVRAQIELAGTPRQLTLARAIIEAKVRKQIILVQRFGRRDHVEMTAEAVSAMEHVLAMVPEAATSQELMGLEGAAAGAYFPALGALLPPDLAFSVRSRQPPLDVANSALSFLYTVLLGECVTALYAAGLDPAFGVVHSDHENRPSLALDLLEELRPMVVDQVVLSAARGRELRAEHGRSEEGRAGVFLTKAGREAVLSGYERRMLTRTKGALPEFAGTLRRHVYRQAQRLCAAIIGPDPGVWTGMSWR